MDRFPILTLFGYFLRFAAIACPLIGLLAISEIGAAGFIASLVVGLIIWVYAEITGVVLSIERNTYESKQHLSALVQAQRTVAPAQSSVRQGTQSTGSQLSKTPQEGIYVPSGTLASAPNRVNSSSGTSPFENLPDGALLLMPASGSAGTLVKAEFNSFHPQDAINIKWHSAFGSSQDVATVLSNDHGIAVATFNVPGNELHPGNRTVEAVSSRGRRALARFTIVSNT